jgi:tRNA(fMet)-specific endonuclease VapC
VRFLLDANVLSEPRSPKPSRETLSKLTEHAAQSATAAPCLHELIYGAERLPRSARRTEVEAFVSDIAQTLRVLPYDQEAAAWHARERARLEKSGKTPPFVDGQIAAIAATQGLTLVTKNTRDFAILKGLRVERW